MSEQCKATIGITRGDQAGIGPEVVAAALASGELSAAFKYELIGEVVDAVPGQPSAKTAKAALDALEEAVEMLESGRIDAVVTAPVGKEGLHDLGFYFPGQTEFFAERLGCDNHAMCLTGKTTKQTETLCRYIYRKSQTSILTKLVIFEVFSKILWKIITYYLYIINH